MLPPQKKMAVAILKVCADGNKHHVTDLEKILGDQFELSYEQRNQLKTSGGERLFLNRIRWTTFELLKAGLVNREKAIVSITEQGRNVLKQNPDIIDRKYLNRFPAFREYIAKIRQKNKQKDKQKDKPSKLPDQTPEEMIHSGHQLVRQIVENELLTKTTESTPDFFEGMVLELIRKMGYGISHEVLGGAHDGGIDGVILEDKLGMDEIYFQAKRWSSTVPIHQVRDFAGALMSKKSKRGIFITSSTFSPDTYEYIESIDAKIILIDGKKLTEYMYDYNLGVKIIDNYEIKKIDEEYF